MHTGFMQATGWPSVVAVMANWYGKGKRGAVMGELTPSACLLICQCTLHRGALAAACAVHAHSKQPGSMPLPAGIWNAHTSVGNILGSAVAAACLSWGWGWAFLIPGAALAFTGVIIWLFLVVEPEEAGLMKMRDSLVVSHPFPETLGQLESAGAVPAAFAACTTPAYVKVS